VTTATDTSPEAQAFQLNIFRQMTPEGRLQAAMDLAQTSRQLLAQGVLQRHPEYSQEEARLAVIRLVLGKELFAKTYATAKGIHV
jgi:hypothetical protein